MTTICPAYEGSERTSWYPVMQVLITTSPLAWVAWPPRSPNTVKPSSRTRTTGSGMLHHTLRHHLATTDRHDDPSAQSPALERCVLAATLEGRRIDRPLFVGIDQDPLVFQRLAHDLSRPGYASPIDDAAIEAEPEDDANGRLKPMEAVRAGLLCHPLVRRMVGSDHVDHPIQQTLVQGIAVIDGSQRRIDSALWVNDPRIPLRQHQVVRRDLGRDRQSLRLRRANQLDSSARAHVLDMKACGRQVAQGIQGIG